MVIKSSGVIIVKEVYPLGGSKEPTKSVGQTGVKRSWETEKKGR